jgi:hypothetical protein
VLGLLLVPLGLAVAEEALWDRLVWGEQGSLFGEADPWPALLSALGLGGGPAEAPEGEGAPSDAALAVATALLSVPQVSHYLLDGLMWRSGKDPSLRRLLGPDPAPPR